MLAKSKANFVVGLVRLVVVVVKGRLRTLHAVVPAKQYYDKSILSLKSPYINIC